MLKNILIAALILLLLTSCSFFRADPPDEPILDERPKLSLDIPPIQMSDVPLVVVVPGQARERAEEYGALYCVDDQGYENLSVNIRKMTNHIKLLHQALERYKEYYEGEGSE